MVHKPGGCSFIGFADVGPPLTLPAGVVACASTPILLPLPLRVR
jgi:hypothetical protein